jgi:PASTA domain-containing protein
MHTTFPATNPKPVKRIVLLCGVAALLLAGCGDDAKSQDGDVKSTTSSTATTTTTAPTATTTASTATSGTTAAAAKITVPNVVGKDLQLAQDTMQAAGLYHLTSHDSTGQARLQVLDRNWLVTDQTPAAGSRVAEDQLIDLGARKFTD